MDYMQLTEGELRDALASGRLDPAVPVSAPQLDKVCLPDGKLFPLMLVAFSNQNSDLIDVLVDAGAEVNALSPSSKLTALSFAAMGNPNREMTETLIEYGADYDHRDGEGRTPLMRASEVGNRQAALALICHVSNIDERDANGMTSLMIAVDNLNLDIAWDLIDAGANREVSASDGDSLTALYERVCLDRGFQPDPEILERLVG